MSYSDDYIHYMIYNHDIIVNNIINEYIHYIYNIRNEYAQNIYHI